MLFGIRPPSSKTEKKVESETNFERQTDSLNEWIVPADWATQQTLPPKLSHKVFLVTKLPVNRTFLEPFFYEVQVRTEF